MNFLLSEFHIQPMFLSLIVCHSQKYILYNNFLLTFLVPDFLYLFNPLEFSYHLLQKVIQEHVRDLFSLRRNDLASHLAQWNYLFTGQSLITPLKGYFR